VGGWFWVDAASGGEVTEVAGDLQQKGNGMEIHLGVGLMLPELFKEAGAQSKPDTPPNQFSFHSSTNAGRWKRLGHWRCISDAGTGVRFGRSQLEVLSGRVPRFARGALLLDNGGIEEGGGEASSAAASLDGLSEAGETQTKDVWGAPADADRGTGEVADSGTRGDAVAGTMVSSRQRIGVRQEGAILLTVSGPFLDRNNFLHGSVQLGSTFPVLNLGMVFVVGDCIDRDGERWGAGGLLDLAAQPASDCKELRGGEVLDIASGEFGFDFLELLAEAVEAVGEGGEPFIGEGLKFDGAKVLDLELVFAAPGNQSGFGDVEFGGNSGKGPTLRAELDKALNSLFGVHG